MPISLNDRLLDAYGHSFFGYGRWDAPYWFIGVEEACYFTVEGINNRLKVWQSRGCKMLEDMKSFAPAIGINGWHGEGATIQPTWGKLIRVLLHAKACDVNRNSILEYQKTLLGNSAGKTCLAELLPFPSPNTKCWFYNGHSSLPYAQDRQRYQHYMTTRRIAEIRRNIENYRPKFVVLYGTAYMKQWRLLVPDLVSHPDILTGRVGVTPVFVMRHPAARHTNGVYFDGVGDFIRRSVDSL